MKGELPVEVLCELLAVSRSGYYRWKEGRQTQRQRDDAQLAEQIAAAHARSRKNYGAPRIVEELRRRHADQQTTLYPADEGARTAGPQKATRGARARPTASMRFPGRSVDVPRNSSSSITRSE